MKLAGHFTDAWSNFFNEANRPRSKTNQIQWGIIWWTPIVLYALYVLISTIIVIGMKLIGIKTQINMDSIIQIIPRFKALQTAMAKILLATPIMQQILVIIGIVILIFLMICIWSLIARRGYDIGLTLPTSITISTIITIIEIIMILPIIESMLTIAFPPAIKIIHIINHSNIYHMLHIFMHMKPAIIFNICVYLIYQIFPTNIVLSATKRTK